MGTNRRFPKTLKAVRQAGITQGGIGSALRVDVIANGQGPDAQTAAPFEECEVYLRDHGHEFEAQYLRALHRAAATTELEYFRDGWTRLPHQR